MTKEEAVNFRAVFLRDLRQSLARVRREEIARLFKNESVANDEVVAEYLLTFKTVFFDSLFYLGVEQAGIISVYDELPVIVDDLYLEIKEALRNCEKYA